MKRLLFLSFLLSFAPSVNADSFCTLKSEAETDITLEMKTHHNTLHTL